MAKKWIDAVKKHLKQNDVIKHSWPGKYCGKRGHIVLSKTRVFFVEELGLVNRKANLLLDLPYEQISLIKKPETPLEITTTDGEKQYITPLLPDEVEGSLEELLMLSRGRVVDMLLHN